MQHPPRHLYHRRTTPPQAPRHDKNLEKPHDGLIILHNAAQRPTRSVGDSTKKRSTAVTTLDRTRSLDDAQKSFISLSLYRLCWFSKIPVKRLALRADLSSILHRRAAAGLTLREVFDLPKQGTQLALRPIFTELTGPLTISL